MPQRSVRDILAERVNAAKKGMAEAMAKRLGPPPSKPSSGASLPQKDDEYTAWWRPAKGWEDPAAAEQQAQAMYAQGAKPQDVLQEMYPDRMKLLVLGTRRDNLKEQVAFAEEMVTQRAMKAAELVKHSMNVLQKESPPATFDGAIAHPFDMVNDLYRRAGSPAFGPKEVPGG